MKKSRYIIQGDNLVYIDSVTSGTWTLLSKRENQFHWESSHGGLKFFSNVYSTYYQALFSMIEDIRFYQSYVLEEENV